MTHTQCDYAGAGGVSRLASRVSSAPVLAVSASSSLSAVGNADVLSHSHWEGEARALLLGHILFSPLFPVTRFCQSSFSISPEIHPFVLHGPSHSSGPAMREFLQLPPGSTRLLHPRPSCTSLTHLRLSRALFRSHPASAPKAHVLHCL